MINFRLTKKKYLKYIYFLWKNKVWTGGRSFGKKIFWGKVGSSTTKWFFWLINRKYLFCNVKGLLQGYLKNKNINYYFGLIFFSKYGFFSLMQVGDGWDYKTPILYEIPFKGNLSKGLSTLIKNFSVGALIFNIQTDFFSTISFIRSKGAFGKIFKKTQSSTYVQLPSGVIYIYLNTKTSATLGLVSKSLSAKLSKAGDSRHAGWIPKVRGIAMNPVDHPHGGWTNKGCHPVTPQGFLTKNVKTWKKKKWSNNLIFKFRYGPK